MTDIEYIRAVGPAAKIAMPGQQGGEPPLPGLPSPRNTLFTGSRLLGGE